MDQNKTITTAVLVFAAGAVFALKSAGTANTDKDSADTVVAAANEATDLVVKETVSEKETEVITETAATEATTEEATEAVTEQSSTIAEIQPQTEVATLASDGVCTTGNSVTASVTSGSIRCKSCTGYSRN